MTVMNLFVSMLLNHLTIQYFTLGSEVLYMKGAYVLGHPSLLIPCSNHTYITLSIKQRHEMGSCGKGLSSGYQQETTLMESSSTSPSDLTPPISPPAQRFITIIKQVSRRTGRGQTRGNSSFKHKMTQSTAQSMGHIQYIFKTAHTCGLYGTVHRDA